MKPSKPKRLPKSQLGVSFCEPWGNTDTRNQQICVEGGRYGFQAKLANAKGEMMYPISVGRAQTARTAMQAARTSMWRQVHQKFVARTWGSRRSEATQIWAKRYLIAADYDLERGYRVPVRTLKLLRSRAR